MLSADCTSAEGDPSVDVCAVQAVADRSPSPSNHVPVRMEYVNKIRYCGATDYAMAPGEPPGQGGSPDYGCV